MNSWIPIAVALIAASAFGFWYQNTRGEFKRKNVRDGKKLSPVKIEHDLGSRATMVQFSSAFCTPCRQTQIILEDLVKSLPDVAYVHLDSESHMGLVRELNIMTTPTTLFLNKDGIEVGRATGTPKKQQVLSALQEIH